MKVLDIYVTYLVPFAVLIPILSGLLNFRYLNTTAKIILGFVFFSALTDSINLYLLYHGYKTVFILHFYSIFEFAFLSAYFATLYDNKKRKIFYIVAVGIAVFSVINLLYIQKLTVSNTYPRSIGSILVIGYCMAYFLKQNNNDVDISWGTLTTNWLTTGILIYYGTSLAMFMFENYLLYASMRINAITWGAHDTALVFEYIFFAIGFKKCRPQPTISTY